MITRIIRLLLVVSMVVAPLCAAPKLSIPKGLIEPSKTFADLSKVDWSDTSDSSSQSGASQASTEQLSDGSYALLDPMVLEDEEGKLWLSMFDRDGNETIQPLLGSRTTTQSPNFSRPTTVVQVNYGDDVVETAPEVLAEFGYEVPVGQFGRTLDKTYLMALKKGLASLEQSSRMRHNTEA